MQKFLKKNSKDEQVFTEEERINPIHEASSATIPYDKKLKDATYKEALALAKLTKLAEEASGNC